MRVAIALLAGVAAVAAPQEELTVERLLEKMDAAAEAARGTTLQVRAPRGANSAVWLLASSGTADIAVARDGTVRVRFDEGEGAVQMPGFSRSTPERIFISDRDALTIIQEWPSRSAQNVFLRRRTERVTPSPDVDPFTESSAWGTPMSTLSSVLLHALAPSRTFAFHGGLELMGRRRAGNEEFWVLMSRRRMEIASPMTGRIDGIVRKFHVSAADFRLRRIEERIASTGGLQDFRMIWTLDGYDGAVPGRIESTFAMDQFTDYSWSMQYESADVRKGIELDGAALRAPADDVYATKARHAGLDKLLQQSPDDADLNWSKAVALASAENEINLMGRAQAPDPGSIVAAIEKALEKAWAPTLVRNLLGLYAHQKADEKAAALAERVVKDGKRTAGMALDAAEALNRLGRPDDALRLLADLKGAPERRVAEERIAAHLLKGDPAAALAVFLPLATPDWIARLKTLYESAGDEIRKKVSREELMKALDAAIAAAPKSPLLHLARLTILEEVCEVESMVAAIEAAWKSTEDRSVDEAASRILSAMLEVELPGVQAPMVVGPNVQPKPKFDTEKVKAAMKAVMGAIDAAGSRPDARVLRGQALLLSGDKDAALKEFAAALEAAGPSGSGEQAGRLAEVLSSLGDDGLLEKACLLALERSTKSSLAADIMMGWGRTQSPLAAYVKLCMKNKKYAELFKVVRQLDFSATMGLPMYFMTLQINDTKDFFAAAKQEALKDEKDVKGLKWLARQVVTGERWTGMQTAGLDAGELWEKVRERAPGDLEGLQALAEHYARKNDKARVFKACEEVIAALDAGATCEKPWSTARAWLTIAQQQSDGDKIREALGKIDLVKADLAAWELWAVGELAEANAQHERAIEAMNRLEREGYRPYLRMAQLHTRKENWMEAMRAINRAIAFGWEAPQRKPQSIYDSGLQPAPESTGPAEDPAPKMRAELLKKVGQDWFIDRLAESKLPVLGAEDERRARDAYAKLSGDDLGERDDATEALRKLGKGCTLIIKPGLKSDDEEVRVRVRTLLTEWAEPR